MYKNALIPPVGLARWLAIGVRLVLLASAVLVVTSPLWMTPSWLLHWADTTAGLPKAWQPAAVDGMAVWAARMGVLLPGLAGWGALWNLHHFLHNALSPIPMNAHLGVHLRRVGCCVMAMAVLQTLGTLLAVLALTASNPTGQRVLTLMLEPGQLVLAASGALVSLLGHVVLSAADAIDENRQFV